jgi:hypothetical protein
MNGRQKTIGGQRRQQKFTDKLPSIFDVTSRVFGESSDTDLPKIIDIFVSFDFESRRESEHTMIEVGQIMINLPALVLSTFDRHYLMASVTFEFRFASSGFSTVSSSIFCSKPVHRLRFLPSHRRNLKMRWNWAISEASTK